MDMAHKRRSMASTVMLLLYLYERYAALIFGRVVKHPARTDSCLQERGNFSTFAL